MTGAVILFPLVVTMVFLVIHAALVYHARSIVAAAAEDAARAAQVEGGSAAEGQAVAGAAARGVSRSDPRSGRPRRAQRDHRLGDRARHRPRPDPVAPRHGQRQRRRPRRALRAGEPTMSDRGSAGLSVVLLTPVILALLAFAVLAGRIGTADQDVVSARRPRRVPPACARAAVQPRPTPTTRPRRRCGEQASNAPRPACRPLSAERRSRPPSPVRSSCPISSTFRCRGRRRITASASAPVDVYRGGS